MNVNKKTSGLNTRVSALQEHHNKKGQNVVSLIYSRFTITMR